MGHRHTHSTKSFPSQPSEESVRGEIDGLLGNVLEFVVLLLTGLAPWAFGATEPVFEFLLDAGVAVVLCLWSLRALVRGRWSLAKCPVALCLFREPILPNSAVPAASGS